MKRYLALLLALVMLLSLAACTKAPAQTADEQTPETTGTTETATEQTSEQPAAESGTLKLVWHAATGIDTLFENPWRDVQCLYPYMVFDRLVSVNGSGEYVMGLATDYTVSDDGLTYTFTIRDGVTWQDGTPFTADDVVFSLWGNIANPNTAVGKSEISCIEGADAVMNEGAQMLSGVSADGNTVTVKLTAPSRGFMAGVAQVAILPKHAFEGVAPADFNTCSFWEKPFGTGAYKIDQVSFPDYFTCVRNENYWGEPAGIENVLFTSYATGGNDAIVASMIAGDLDFAYGNAMNDIAVADNIKAQNADVESYLLTSNYMRFFIFNQVGASDGQENPGIKDNRVRQAINLLIDKEAFASLYAGQAEVKTTYLANSHPYYNTDIVPFERDVEKAKELLEEAGFDYSKKIRICYYYDDQTTVDAMDLVCQNLADAGITAEAFLATGDLGSILYDVHNYDIMYAGWNKLDPVILYTNFTVGGGEDPIMGDEEYRREVFNTLLDKYNATTDDASAKEAAYEIQAAAMEYMATAPIYGLNTVFIANSAHVSIPSDVLVRDNSYTTDWQFSSWKLVG